ncbi:hypothetical protein DVH24_022590 [Malus domestica]|uniref:Uncharacterized protein n=1 Tax=Malus domestica TaxID=3750 RepID=A0A498KLU4_MALDO|nr:hypothetical protein DVH24_022590 [Malus domestica]
MDSACGNYQVGDSINDVGSGPSDQPRSGPVLSCHVPLTSRNDGGSLGLACRVSSLGSTWLSMCESPTWDPISGSHVRGHVEMSHIDRINEKKKANV